MIFPLEVKAAMCQPTKMRDPVFPRCKKGLEQKETVRFLLEPKIKPEFLLFQVTFFIHVLVYRELEAFFDKNRE